MNEMMEEFLKDTRQGLAGLEEKLRVFISAPSEELVSLFLKAFQALKKEARDLNLSKIESIADAALLVLDRIGAGAGEVTADNVALLKDCFSALRENLDALDKTGHEAPVPQADLTAQTPPRAETGSEPGRSETSTGAAAMSLNDVAALLVQLDAENLSGCRRLGETLQELAGSHANEEVAKRLREAGSKLLALADSGGDNPDAVLQEVASAIEDATQGEELEELAAAPEPPEVIELTLPADADLELMGEFVTESREFIAEAESALLSLEVDPDKMEAVNTVFRAFHTIKGTSGFLGLKPLTELAHHAESLLSKVRNREIHFSGGYADLALRSIDTLKGLVEQVDHATRGKAMVLPAGYQDLLKLLKRADHERFPENMAEAPPDSMRVGDILVAAQKADREKVDQVAAQQGDEPIGVALVRSKAASLTDVAKALRAQQRIAAGEKSSESTVRVRTERLDRLIDMVGELVIAQSMVAQDATLNAGTHHELGKKISHAGKIVRELQDLSMSMRMVPFRATFQKTARVVRDLARKSGKIVEFDVKGEDTEIDRNMVDHITDPLVHMVRNAVDHGIEPPDEREKLGKPSSGLISVKAFHSGGNVVVELSDDGRGLDRDKIIQTALATGLIESDKGLADVDVYNLIFAPGFSTAAEVTDVSGRGVGLDVVKRNVDALRGRIEITSSPGVGCKFSLRLPLTLAITDGMQVKVGDEYYIVPTINIQVSFRPSSSALFTVARRGELVMLRGELMAMFRLHRLFDVKGAVEDPTKGLLVVVGDGNRRCALLVDELLGQQQVVAKSLGRGLGKVQGISGGAILGDGKVGLILDTMELVSLARQVTSGAEKVELEPAGVTAAQG
ncbi:MAG: chemotaxis protein CheA [Acidobacteria bacterium]|nr:MAG: chemotaxis protein CheA [Acidobacteriota bacterium]